MATAVLLGIAVVLSILNALMFGALVEMYRQIQHIRDSSGLLDQPMSIDVRMGSLLPTERMGYRASEAVNGVDRHALLFLSDSCTTCERVAKGIPAKFTPRLTVLVEARDDSSALRWMDKFGLTELPQAQYDRDRVVADETGVSVIPSIVLFEDGAVIGGHTMPSRRHIKAVLTWVNGIDDYPFAKLKTATKEGSSGALT